MDYDSIRASIPDGFIQRQAASDLVSDFENADANGNATEWASGEFYCKHVLQIELALLLHKEGQPVAPPPKLMVLLCGMSEAPLLLAAAWAKPGLVMLVHSEGHVGKESATSVRELLNGNRGCFREQSQHAVFQIAKDVAIDGSDPAKAYRSLVASLTSLMNERQLTPSDVIIDITGGKKTMVSAAFLAASQLGLRTQYVDFGEYSLNARMPVPTTASVRLLSDPAAVFRLRDQEAAKNAFDNERWHDALTRLEEMLQVMGAENDRGYILEDVRRCLQIRRDYAKAMVGWVEFRYDDALTGMQELHKHCGVTIPRPLLLLGTLWQKTRKDPKSRRSLLIQGDSPKGLTASNYEVLAGYLGDEWWRHRRSLQRNEDCRNPFTRTYALLEVALTAVVYPHRCNIRVHSGGTNLVEQSLGSYWGVEGEKKVGLSDFKRLSIRGMAGLAGRGEVEVGRADRVTFFLDPASDSSKKLKVPTATELLDEGDNKWAEIRNECAHAAGVVERATALAFVGTSEQGAEKSIAGRMLHEVYDSLKSKDLFDKIVNSPELHAPMKWEHFE